MSPDISMCQAEDTEIEERNNSSYIKRLNTNVCPLRETCYRYKAKPDKYMQSFSDFRDALNEDKTECEYLMPIWDDRKKGSK